MCSHRPGSKVIICTDGLANIGIGSLDEETADREASDKFYEKVRSLCAWRSLLLKVDLVLYQVGAWARDIGVVVSVVSITGTECRIENLGQLADLTCVGSAQFVLVLKTAFFCLEEVRQNALSRWS